MRDEAFQRSLFMEIVAMKTKFFIEYDWIWFNIRWYSDGDKMNCFTISYGLFVIKTVFTEPFCCPWTFWNLFFVNFSSSFRFVLRFKWSIRLYSQTIWINSSENSLIVRMKGDKNLEHFPREPWFFFSFSNFQHIRKFANVLICSCFLDIIAVSLVMNQY